MSSTMLEVEQKFAVGNFAGIERVLNERSIFLSDPIVQVDRYFGHPARNFAQTDEALRIRRVGDENRITYKGPKLDAVTKTRREIELPLASGAAAADAFGELLSALGFSPAAEVRKTRRTARLMHQGFSAEIALDDVAGVGTFVELEIAAGPPQLEAARSAVVSLGAQLGLTNIERRSYLELLLAASPPDCS
jgi:adenylate cyclase class 2